MSKSMNLLAASAAAMLDARPITFDGAIGKLLSGWTVRSIDQPFYRGGATYTHAIVSMGFEARVVSNATWKHLGRWIEENGQIAIIKHGKERYLVRGKSGMTAGHIWKARDTWILQMHATPAEPFATAKAAKADALEAALRY